MNQQTSQKQSNPIATYVRQEHILKGINKRLNEAKANTNSGIFITNLLDIVRHSPDLLKADPESVVAICLAVTMMGLKFDKNLGQAFIIPFNQKNKEDDTSKIVPQLQIGWKGYKALAIQSGEYKRIGVSEVYEFDDDEAVHSRLFSLLPPPKGNSNQIIGYVAAYELKSGYQESFFMNMRELDEHKSNFSKGNPVWNKHKHAMCKKTVLKYLLKSGSPLGGLANQIYVNQAITLDGHSAVLDNFDDDASTGVITQCDYQDDNNVYEHAPVEQTQTQYGNVPKVQADHNTMKKIISSLQAGTKTRADITSRYELNQSQMAEINAVFQ